MAARDWAWLQKIRWWTWPRCMNLERSWVLVCSNNLVFFFLPEEIVKANFWYQWAPNWCSGLCTPLSYGGQWFKSNWKRNQSHSYKTWHLASSEAGDGKRPGVLLTTLLCQVVKSKDIKTISSRPFLWMSLWSDRRVFFNVTLSRSVPINKAESLLECYLSTVT